ncbi:uncharacterized protein [Paramormyrops kingsleyae]|uniref:uncharacterized protein n=1 Tax=Paramormyrops kingsleyae TaxID=1676925 RepID=UPI003B977171
MLRVALLVSISALLHAGIAKPYPSWAKVMESQFQETLRSKGLNQKVALGMKKLEPMEDLTQTFKDDDPDMSFWGVKNAGGSHQKYHLAEEDPDELYHPSLEQLAQAPHQSVPLKLVEEPSFPMYIHPEEDRDLLHHGDPPAWKPPLQPEPKQEEEPRPRIYTHPEEDRDHLYHP